MKMLTNTRTHDANTVLNLHMLQQKVFNDGPIITQSCLDYELLAFHELNQVLSQSLDGVLEIIHFLHHDVLL